MATINLGNIKFTWKGAYNAGTAYAIDDVVSYNGSSYVCILASTGNLPTNTTYWNVMSSKGTDADLLNIASTAQGDIYYNNGSAIARLAPGTAGQVLQMNAGATAPEYANISSDFVKLASQDLDSTGLAIVEFQNCFSAANDALYGGYQVIIFDQNNGANDGLNVRYMYGTNTEIGGSTDYTRAGGEGYRQTNNNGNNFTATNDGDGRNSMDWENWGQNGANDTTEGQMSVAWFQGGMYRNDIARNVWVNSSMRDSSSPNYVVGKTVAYRYHGTQNITGLKFYVNNGTMSNGAITLWGMKK
tara:strand:+ start:482 stop:1384 length:903 start_codon:yes stop_codon:yes gene_type:complete